MTRAKSLRLALQRWTGLLLLPLMCATGCGRNEKSAKTESAEKTAEAPDPLPIAPPAKTTESSEPAEGSGEAGELWHATLWTATRDGATGAWEYVKGKAGEGLVIATETSAEGKDAALETGEAVWVWSKDKSADGWAWIRAQASEGGAWASDQAGSAWMLTKEKSGQAYLWVQVKVDDGVAWTRTALPAGWEVTRDEAERVWVWTGKHKLEAAVAGAIVAVVVTAFVLAPEATAWMIARAATTKAGGKAVEFLTKLYADYQKVVHPATEEEFIAVGHGILAAEGEHLMQRRGAEEKESEAGE